VEVCPAGAKKVRDDLPRAKQLMEMHGSSLSISPSFYGEYGEDAPRVMGFLRLRGAEVLEETALGAEAINRGWKKQYKNTFNRGILSSACPVVVRYISLYKPDLLDALMPMDSPMVVHGGMLKEEQKENPVIFIGPCIAKKDEADHHPGQVDIALTFQELNRWIEEEGGLPPEQQGLYCKEAERAALYPLEGGMVRSIQEDRGRAVSGMSHLMDILDQWNPDAELIFLECLSCTGGCINGPAKKENQSFLLRQERILQDQQRRKPLHSMPEEAVLQRKVQPPQPLKAPEFEEVELMQALIELDKADPANRLNCGSCGYPTCEAFALSWLMGKSEKEMCAGNMRKLAQKKVNALIRELPLGVVMVDQHMKIVELNGPFLQFFSEADTSDYEMINRKTRGLSVSAFAPLEPVLKQVMDKPSRQNQQLKTERGIFDVHCFTVEPQRLAGAVIEDVTKPAIRRETIVSKAEEVIRKNLESVQQIASVLGENAAETEIILNSVIHSMQPREES